MWQCLTDREDHSAVLSLGFAPPVPLINSNPIRVYYAVSHGSDEPTTFDPHHPLWSLRKSSGERRRTNELLNVLQDARVAGTRLIEYVWYENTSMWQFLPAYIWLQFFVAVELIDVLRQIIGDVRPNKIRFFPTSDPTSPIWHGTVRAVGMATGIPVSVVHERTIRGVRIEARNFLRQLGVGRLLRLLRRQVASFRDAHVPGPKTHPRTANPASKTVVFLTLGKRHWVPLPGEPGRNYDEQMYPLLPAFRSKGWTDFVMVDCLDLPLQQLEKRMLNGETGVRWRNYSSYKKRNGATFDKAKAFFASMWRSLQQDRDFIEDFKYRNVPLTLPLSLVLERAFLKLLPECALMLETASRILDEEHADAVIATYETGPWERAVTIEAARVGIPTVGLQHGMIFEGDPDNLHLRVTSNPNAPGFMVPQITCVWGPFWKDVLTKAGHYTPQSVVITGNWRYDRLSEIIQRTDASMIRRRYGIGPGKKLVLLLSVGLGTVEYLRTCLQTVAAREELSPLIRLHPGADKPEPVLRMLRELNYSSNTIVKGQLIDALVAADLVVSQYSTAISEAALLDKPVIMADFQDFRGGEDYLDSGICLYATDSQHLLRAIEKGLYDESVRSQMRSAREAFVARYFFKLDGRAAERVVDALEALVQTRHDQVSDSNYW